MLPHASVCFFFFFNDTATTEIYTLSLHDALPISTWWPSSGPSTLCSAKWIADLERRRLALCRDEMKRDRKSTRLNSSHVRISYAVFCLKKKKKKQTNRL